MNVSGDPSVSYESENRITPIRIGIVTPAPPGSRRGNRITAERWRIVLARLGYGVDVVESYTDEPFDILIVLHATRGIDSIRRFRERHSHRPLIVAITGTDIYGGHF